MAQGKPEGRSDGAGGVLQTHSTEEGGELALAGTHWRKGANK